VDRVVQAPPQQYRYAQDLPQHAHQRLWAMRQHHFFTSDLSVNEFLLVKEAGFHPLGLVMGSSIFHVGFQQVRQGVNEELTNLSQALYHSRELAMARLEEEADELGADGIVAVRLTVNLHAWGANIIEFLAIGTAVKAEIPGNWRAPDGKPFQSDLSGQDFWTLMKAGYRPVGFVMGNCVYYIGQPLPAQMAAQSPAYQQQGYPQAGFGPQMQGYQQPGQGYPQQVALQNQELTGPTQALYDARELAMERMQAEAEAVQAHGIVGVTVEETNHTWGPTVLEFSAVGTAVMAIRDDHHIQQPTLVLSVNE
jgi:uncharacterized protein YbjQ (UPF0145 family)